MENGDASLVAEECLRVYRRYQVEIVEALKLCPWAERARLEGRVRERVLTGPALDVDATLAAIDEIAQDDRIEVGLVLFPLAPVSYPELERFVARLVEEDQGRRELGTAPFALAAFHPEAPCDPAEPERLIPFLRRSPDPTIQLVRRTALERVREGFAEGTQFVDLRALSTLDLTREDTLPLRERIARANHRTALRLGVAELEARLRDIRRDRDAAYARLGFPR